MGDEGGRRGCKLHVRFEHNKQIANDCNVTVAVLLFTILFNVVQRSEWKLHRLECQVLSRLDHDKRKSLTPSIRLMLRLHLRRKLQNDKVYRKVNI